MDSLRTRLERLSGNVWWTWKYRLDWIFRTIDVDLWRAVNHNPTAFLHDVDPKRLEAFEQDTYVLARTIRAEAELASYLGSDQHWASYHAPGLRASPVAYFSPEFALHESLPIYSGGLGVLAGDHLKSCSDLGVPTYGVTLLYREGYFVQQIDGEGIQGEAYQTLDMDRVAIEPARDARGSRPSVEVLLPGSPEVLDVWQMFVGRCRLILLDLRRAPESSHADALRLYGGDRSTRLVQEMALGLGGYRALLALGLRPGVIHLNEGHSAFAVLEAIAHRMELSHRSFGDVAEEVARSVVFTTHTPVPAGHDRFPPQMILEYLEPLQQRLGLDDAGLLGLGRVRPEDPQEEFCMTVLALKLSRRANAVSSLHGHISRKMWHNLWPGRAPAEIPIAHVTNGIHVETWLAVELSGLYSDCLGKGWLDKVCEAATWRPIERLSPYELWSIKLALKQRLLRFMLRRERARRQRLNDTSAIPELHLDRLTIGFGRRFAAYKRALLFFRDFKRAKRLLTDPARPVQVVFAGKAHPADEPSQALIRRISEIAADPELRGHVVVLEDYDMNVARHLIEGCDLWLNAPRRPQEACGTSGMKAVFNATLNCSVLDGWWAEAYDTQNGFAFGSDLVHADPNVQDEHDAADLMRVLEDEVVPLYYQRNGEGIPVSWLDRVIHALRTLAWRYNSDRMIMDYVRHMYLDASGTTTASFPE